MELDAVDIDFASGCTFNEWLESEESAKVQRHLEERIMTLLFSHDPESPAFQKMAIQLAMIGCRPEAKSLLAREIRELDLSEDFSIDPCGFFKTIGKASRKVGSFVCEHAFDILVGAAVCATGAGLAAVTGYTFSAAVGGVVVAGAGSIFHSEEKSHPKIPRVPHPQDYPKEQLAALQHCLSNPLPKIELPSSADAFLVTPHGIWANGQFFSTETLLKHSSLHHPEMDWKTFAHYNYLSQQFNLETQGHTPSYQARGENALVFGDYHQAIQDFGKAIETDPGHPASYLERGIAHFELGNYESSMADYRQFVEKAEPFSVTDFTLGFAKGVPKGAYESGKGALLFLADLIKHPLQTSKQVLDSLSKLATLVKNDEFGVVAETLSPEFHQLVTQWDTLPSETRGELAGYAVGKLGTDLLAPGALAKVASHSVNSAKELVAVCKNLQIVQETLLLETAAGIGIPAKVSEIISMGKKTVGLGEELGFTAQEMGQLKQAGKLEATIGHAYEHLTPPMRESFEFYKKAQDALKPYVKKPMPEFKVRELIHETGIPTFPRPKGIPEDFLVMVTDKGAGMEYVHPTNTHIRIRVMPGKPHSSLPYQQKPYVVQMKEGKALDKFGNEVNKKSLEAHIPIDEFNYIN